MDPGLPLFIAFFTLLLLGVPIAIALGATAAFFIWSHQLGVQALSANFYAGVAKFQLLAIPFFILAGMLMERSGISERLVHLAGLLIGPIPGGLALASVPICVLFAGISGSGPAETAALGAVLIPAMVVKGYEKGFASALIASGGSIAIVVPPSIAFIVYGVIAQVSIPALFAAGILPGLLLGSVLAIPTYLTSKQHGYGGGRRGSLKEIGHALKEATWGLLAPLIILGGIYGGVVTPTEAAVVAVFYGLLVGVLIYRTISLKDLYEILRDAAVASSVVMLIVAFAGLYAWAGSTLGVMDRAARLFLALSSSPWAILLLVNVLLLLTGMVLDAISIYYVFLPVLLPIVAHFQWDPVWFGVVMTVNLAIGQVTPPVAVNLYVATHIAGVPLERTAVAVLPFIASMLLALLVVTLFPTLSTSLPLAFGLAW